MEATGKEFGILKWMGWHLWEKLGMEYEGTGIKFMESTGNGISRKQGSNLRNEWGRN